MSPKSGTRGARQHSAFQAGLEGLRQESGLSRKQFAKHLGIPRSSFPFANPSLDYIELIAERAGVDPLTLLRCRASSSKAHRGDIRDMRPAR